MTTSEKGGGVLYRVLVGITICVLGALLYLWLKPAPPLSDQLAGNASVLRTLQGFDNAIPPALKNDQTDRSSAGDVSWARATLGSGIRQGMLAASPSSALWQERAEHFGASAEYCAGTDRGTQCERAQHALMLMGRWIGQLHVACALVTIWPPKDFEDRQILFARTLRGVMQRSGIDGQVIESLVTSSAPRTDTDLTTQHLCQWQREIVNSL